METLREPVNNYDFEAQYENIAAFLVKNGAGSDILGYLTNLYRHSNRWMADKDLRESPSTITRLEDHN
jgi:hypothetical protein